MLYEGVNTGEKDFSALVSKIKQSGADLVYWGGLHTEGGLIVRQMRDQGVKAVMMGGDGITSAEFASIGGPGVEGTLDDLPGPTRASGRRRRKSSPKFKAKNFDPEAYTLYSYAALQMIEQAAADGQVARRQEGGEAEMQSGKAFKTVIGDLSYDKKGDITRPDYVIYTWKKVGDKITYVQN